MQFTDGSATKSRFDDQCLSVERPMPLRLLIVALLLFAVPLMAEAEEGMVIGDQIGVGISWASKLPSVAHNGVAIYSGEVLSQLRQAPRGTTVFMSLGLIDSVSGTLDVHNRVTEINAAREAVGVKLVWIGPPCVLKIWETYAKKLDDVLKSELVDKSLSGNISSSCKAF